MVSLNYFNQKIVDIIFFSAELDYIGQHKLFLKKKPKKDLRASCTTFSIIASCSITKQKENNSNINNNTQLAGNKATQFIFLKRRVYDLPLEKNKN
jgi:hypothetical protein